MHLLFQLAGGFIIAVALVLPGISASQMLERFLLTPDMQYTPVSKLSGGEKRRLYLLSVLVSGANVLILDEPSNNVDIPTLTVLEDFLNTFVGIVITVSHDRYFLDNVVDRIFEFDGNGNLLQYEGGYTDYLEAKERRFGGSAEETAKAAPSKTSADEPAKSKNNDWKQKRPTRLKFTFKEQREYETIDDDIAALEEKIASLDDQMLKNATNSAKLAELMVEKEKTEAALEEKKKREEQEMIEQLRAADQKTAEEEKQDEFEIPDLEEEETEQVSFHTVDLQNLVRGEETEEIPEAVEETEIVEEAAAEETAEEVPEETEETESAEPETVEEIEEFEETIEEPEEEPEPEPSEPIELAMPVYTAEELLQKAHAAGDDPKVIEDPATGITILDYSDIL